MADDSGRSEEVLGKKWDRFIKESLINVEGHMSGCCNRGIPRRRWTQDIIDCLHMTSAEAGHLARDLQFQDDFDEGSGSAVGIVLSFALFRRRPWPVTLLAGFGLGHAYANFKHDLNDPNVLHGKLIKVVTEPLSDGVK